MGRNLLVSRKRRAFTLVEILTVVTILVVLIAILVPVLGRARDLAKTTSCLANIRTVGQAAVQFSADHMSFLQPVSNDPWVQAVDPSHRRYAYWPNGTTKDWISAIIPYMGGSSSDSINDMQSLLTYTGTTNNGQGLPLWVRALRCPADYWVSDKSISQPGYRIFNNVSWGNANVGSDAYYPISYGTNTDLCSVVDQSPATPGFGRYAGAPNNVTDGLNIAGGSTNNAAAFGQPMSAKITAIRNPSNVLLYADCGTRPAEWSSTFPPSGDALDFNDILCYTTNWAASLPLPLSSAKTLDGVAQCNWLGNRIPNNSNPWVYTNGSGTAGANYQNPRHGDAINVAFADGHGETVHRGGFGNVFVSPW